MYCIAQLEALWAFKNDFGLLFFELMAMVPCGAWYEYGYLRTDTEDKSGLEIPAGHHPH